MVYWQKNIYLISDDIHDGERHLPILVYTENQDKARQLSSEHFKDNFYPNENECICETFSPKKYDLIKKKKTCFSDYILISYHGKKIKLKSDQPKNYKAM